MCFDGFFFCRVVGVGVVCFRVQGKCDGDICDFLDDTWTYHVSRLVFSSDGAHEIYNDT